MASSSSSDNNQDIQAQLAILRAQLEELAEKGSAAATDAIRDARRAATSEMDTVCHQMRTQPVATAVIAIAGAAVGYLLGRLTR